MLKTAFKLAHSIAPTGGGTCLEFGVFIGETFKWQASEIKKHFPESSLIGFDSWQGLPAEDPKVWAPSRHEKGGYASTKDVVLQKLRSIGMADDKRIRLIDGFFSESLTTNLQKEIDNVIFINIDVDIYSSTMELLNFVKPLLRPGCVIYWDDWKDPRDEHDGLWGEHRACEEWLSQNPNIEAETIEINPVNQRYMVITKANGSTLTSAGLSMPTIRANAFQINAARCQPLYSKRLFRLQSAYKGGRQ